MKVLAVALSWLACCLAASAGAADSTVSPSVGADPPQQVLVLLNLPAPHYRADGNYSGAYADTSGRTARRRVAQSLARAYGLTLVNDWPMPVIGVDCYVIGVPSSRDADAIAAELGRDPRVSWSQPMHVFRGMSEDPLFNMQPAAHEWQLDELHASATGRNVRVAIIDSGIQLDHPDLRGQLALSVNVVGDGPYVAENHGTAVAGIVAAIADNHVGIAGIAPQASLLSLRACSQGAVETLCNSLGLARALNMAIEHRVQIINLSLSGPGDRLIRQLVEAALKRGVVVVAAVDRAAARSSFPATIGGVIAVTDKASADDPVGTLTAPGTDIPTTVTGSRWAMVSGSSYATAHVSGLVALLLDARARGGKARAVTGADLLRRQDGSVDACGSLARAADACTCSCEHLPSVASTAPH